MASVTTIAIADEPERWTALGFAVQDGVVALRGLALRLGEPGVGITGWAIEGTQLGLVPGAQAEPAREPASHPNTALEVDHVVITTPEFDATAAQLAAAGLPFRRVRQATPQMRQGFRRLGATIMEVVEAPGTERPAFWGLTITVADLGALPREHVSEPRPAVQPGRRIATVTREAGLSTRLAFMDQDRT